MLSFSSFLSLLEGHARGPRQERHVNQLLQYNLPLNDTPGSDKDHCESRSMLLHVREREIKEKLEIKGKQNWSKGQIPFILLFNCVISLSEMGRVNESY